MRLSIKTSLLLFWLVCILLIAAPQSSANQCAEGSTASDTLHIPCLVSEDSLNWFGTEPGPSGLLEMINSGHTETMGDLTECASFDVSEDILYIPCYSSGDAVYWFDLKRSSSLPYTFQLHDYGQMNSFSEHFITDNSAMWTKSHYWNGGDLLSTFRSDHLNFRDGIMELRLDNVPCGNDQLECNGQSYASGEYETTSL